MVASTKVKVGVAQLSVAVGLPHAGVPSHSMDDGPGTPEIIGGVVSSTLNTWVAVAVFPQSSVAVQVRVMVYSFGHDPLVVTSANTNAGVLQLSVTVGVTQLGVPEHSMLDAPGNPLITGGVVSFTFMVWTPVAVFPQASVAVQVRVNVYASGQEPAMVASTNVNVGVEQLSVAVGLPQTGVPEH